MSWTTTPNYGLKKIDFDTEENSWGDILNENSDVIDSNMVGGNTLSPVGSILAWHKTFNLKSTGTSDSTASGKLINSSATFQTDAVEINMIVHNVTDDTWSYATVVDSETQLSLNDDIFVATGKTYNIYATPKLSSDWVECNGQTLSDISSPYDGEVIPDLNAQGRFLRGNSISGIMQNDAMATHNHDQFWGSGAYTGVAGAYSRFTGYETIVSGETRPINMSVVWIMKIK